MDANVTAFVAYCDQSIENLEVKKGFTEDLQMCSYTPKLSGLHWVPSNLPELFSGLVFCLNFEKDK